MKKYLISFCITSIICLAGALKASSQSGETFEGTYYPSTQICGCLTGATVAMERTNQQICMDVIYASDMPGMDLYIPQKEERVIVEGAFELLDCNKGGSNVVFVVRSVREIK